MLVLHVIFSGCFCQWRKPLHCKETPCHARFGFEDLFGLGGPPRRDSVSFVWCAKLSQNLQKLHTKKKHGLSSLVIVTVSFHILFFWLNFFQSANKFMVSPGPPEFILGTLGVQETAALKKEGVGPTALCGFWVLLFIEPVLMCSDQFL